MFQKSVPAVVVSVERIKIEAPLVLFISSSCAKRSSAHIILNPSDDANEVQQPEESTPMLLPPLVSLEFCAHRTARALVFPKVPHLDLPREPHPLLPSSRVSTKAGRRRRRPGRLKRNNGWPAPALDAYSTARRKGRHTAVRPTGCQILPVSVPDLFSVTDAQGPRRCLLQPARRPSLRGSRRGLLCGCRALGGGPNACDAHVWLVLPGHRLCGCRGERVSVVLTPLEVPARLCFFRVLDR